MRWALVLVMVCGACEPGEGSERQPRWPHHREQEEQRISDLEASLRELKVQLAAVERQLRDVQVEQKKRAQDAPPPSPPPPAP